jgi:tryptophan-rich sensory protein
MAVDIVKNIFVLLLPFIVYSTSYLVPSLYDIESPEYKNMSHSKLTLPPWVLFTMWCIIYIVMGASMVKVIQKKKFLILYLYIIQILFNYGRSISLYKFHSETISLILSSGFLLSVITLNYIFYKRNTTSGNIYLIYTIWTIYIFYLSLNLKIKLF